jgi:two-component system, chemotaxis family, sensor histidine kinase and response regulator WspE
MFCPNCGFDLKEDNFNFCPKCGVHLVVPEDMQKKEPPASAVPVATEIDPGQKNILIVEDDLFIRELYQKQLEMAGYLVDVAVDGLEGRDKAQQNHFDLMLLDIMLPKMNGLDLLKIIKEDPKTNPLPVIVLSNLGQDSVVEKALSLGALNYMVKADITPVEMLNVIQSILGP